ncbi:MAG TPA: hypothetical protein VGZ29_14165 [Terriglobia bacterium]|nr:hypothetical protein [Terriglobia bacterium]
MKVYTNDNLPTAGGLTILASPEGAAEANGSSGAPKGKRGEEYYGERAQQLRSRLEIHKLQIEVLQQELSEIQIQYYSSVTQALQHKYSQQDINGLRAAIDAKLQQVDTDQSLLSDLEDQLRREGGDPQWLAAAGSAAAPTSKLNVSGTPKGGEDDWRQRFSAARAALDRVREEGQLAEDELHLLQSRQARDWGTPAAEFAGPKIAEKQEEMESKRAAAEQAREELDNLEKEFRQSGAPEEWSKPSSAEPDASASPHDSSH